jgi:hypothetical protein
LSFSSRHLLPKPERKRRRQNMPPEETITLQTHTDIHDDFTLVLRIHPGKHTLLPERSAC